jgi:arsenite-transporting ATPase
MRIILFTGKGGVGKTTIAAATSLKAALMGHKVLVISTDVAHSLADSFAIPLGNEPTPVGPDNLFAAELDAAKEMERYWGDVKRRLAAILREEGLDSSVAGEMAVIPGLDEIISLVRIKKYFDEAKFDALIIDSAPTGAAMRLLSAPDINRRYVRGMLNLTGSIGRFLLPVLQSVGKKSFPEATLQEKVKELFDRVQKLRQILSDAEITSVRLVLNPDRMAMLETERAFTFFSLYGLSVDAIFVNRVLPTEVVDPYLETWKAHQADYRRRIAETFNQLPIFEVPLQRQEVNGISQLRQLADDLYRDRDPIQRFSAAEPLKFELSEGKYSLTLRLVGVQGKEIDLEKHGDELRVQIGRYQRSLVLPNYLVGLQPTSASLDRGCLTILFEESI